ncbi:MAG: histidine kinase, partial [Thermoleophilia bacterium]
MPPGEGVEAILRVPAVDQRRLAAVTAVFALALGTPLVVIATTADHLVHPDAAAALRAGWIGLYALVGLWFARTRTHTRLGLVMTGCAALSAVAATDVLPGQVAYTFSHIVALALPLSLLLMLIAVPEARGAWTRASRVVMGAVPVVLLLAVAYLTVSAEAPWGQAASDCAGPCAGSAIQAGEAPGLAHGLAVAIALVMALAVGAVALALAREMRVVSPMTRRGLRWIGWLLAIWGGPFVIGLVAVAIDPEPGRLSPFLVTTSVIRVALPLALLAIVLGRVAKTGAMRDELTWRLARAADARSVEQAIGDVVGDPSLRLAFRPGGEWIDAEGTPLDVEEGDEHGWVYLDEERATALVFDPALRSQEERMRVMAGLGAAALDRARTEAELRAARRRLVLVADEERRRIERNLHDGAQQRLIGMTIRVAMAREALASHPDLAAEILGDMGADVQRALDELRELAQGLHPAVLVDHGLAEALRTTARHAPVPIDTDIAHVGRFDEHTEAAVYFCCAEALQNAVKHGGPGATISMALGRDGDGALVFEVADDGRGFVPAAPRDGSGLLGMRERVESVDGTL